MSIENKSKCGQVKGNLDEGGFHPNLLGYKIISDFIYNKIGFQTN